MEFNIPKNVEHIIKVIGVGGGGSNAVTHMFNQSIVGVNFAICNTDSQAMDLSEVPTKIQLGPDLTEGMGAGSIPDVGRKACIESIEDVKKFLGTNTKMVFVTAGMGGGTGTGAAPVIAKAAKEMGVLTVGIVTVPFTFEGRRRHKQAMQGLEELKNNVDTIVVISNDKLRLLHGNLSLSNAFAEVDSILTVAAKGIAEIITKPGRVNVDFEDVNTTMRDSGIAIMGIGKAEGEDRARRAIEEAMKSPLLEDNDIKGARHILLNISSGTKELTMDETFEITEYVQEEAGFGTDLIWGTCYEEGLGEQISITLIATGFETKKERINKPSTERITVALDDDTVKKTNNSIYETGHIKGENSNTVDLDINDFVKKHNKRMYSYDEPYVQGQSEKQQEDTERMKEEQEMKRKERLRNISVKLNNPNTVNELENVPAYLRRKVNLEDVPHSSEENMSEWTISEEKDELKMKKGNSFLHDNVD